MECSTIMAIRLSKRKDEAIAVQNVLTENGCIINLRVGLHETTNQCSDEGLILLHICGSSEELSKLQSQLGKISGVYVNTMDIKAK